MPPSWLMPPAVPHPSPDTLAAYVQGHALPDRLPDLTAHLETCPDCLARLDALRGVEDDLVAGLRSAAVATHDGWGRTPTPRITVPPAVPGYRLGRELGRGGMGVVYEAESLSLGRRVAVKLLRDGGRAGPEVLARFRAEALALGRLQHPNVVQVYESGLAAGAPFVVLELVTGGTLADAAPLAPRAAAVTLMAVARGVQAAHEAGIVHRDLKPANVLLTESGEPKVSDFGLAKLTEAAVTATISGTIAGTPAYMSPEQAAGTGLPAPAMDVYSLGAILYELLAGRPPFTGDSILGVLQQLRDREPPPLGRGVPADLATICRRCLRKEPAGRYASAAAVADDLGRFLSGRPILARRVGPRERVVKWVRRHPAPAALTAALVSAILSGVALVGVQWRKAEAARRTAETARDDADQARLAAERSRAAAQAETYRAVLSEVRALRVGHPPGWRDEALAGLARLAGLPAPRRDLAELRSEAAATLGTPDIRHVATFDLPADDLGSFAFSPDGRTLLTAGSKTGLDFWDVARPGHRGAVAGLTVSGLDSDSDKVLYLPDGGGLAVGTGDRGVVFTDAGGTRTARPPLTRGAGRPTKLAASADGRRLAVAWSDGGGITVHDLAGGALLGHHPDPRGRFALSPDGRWLAREVDGAVVLQPVDPAGPPAVLGRHGGALGFAFSPDGETLAVSFDDHTVGLWDVARRERVGTLRGHREAVFDVAFSPDGGWVATGSLDYTVRVWDAATGQQVATLSGLGPGRRVQWSATGEHLASSTHSSRKVYLFRVTGRDRVQKRLTGHRRELARVAAHPHRDRLATTGYTEMNGWDLSAVRPAPNPLGPNFGLSTALAYSPDGSLLAAAGWVRNPVAADLIVRDARSGQVRGQAVWPHIVTCLAFDPTGRRLASGDRSGTVAVWDVATCRPVRQFETGAEVRSLAWLDRPGRLVANDADGLLLIDPESGKLMRRAALGDSVSAFAADRAGGRLAVGFRSGALGGVTLPDLIPGPRLDAAHTGSVSLMAFSPDGRLLATGGADRCVVLRDAATFEPLLRLPVWAGELRDLTFDAGGRRLAVVGTQCDVDLWDLDELRDGLRQIGLCWDQVPGDGGPPPGEYVRPAVTVVHRPGRAVP